MRKTIWVRSAFLSRRVWRFHINGAETMSGPQKPENNPDPLAALRPNYLRRLAARHEELTRAAADSKARAFNTEEHQALHRLVHSMGSSAAIYGYTDLSGAARAAEHLFEDTSASREAISESLTQVAQEAHAVLDQA